MEGVAMDRALILLRSTSILVMRQGAISRGISRRVEKKSIIFLVVDIMIK